MAGALHHLSQRVVGLMADGEPPGNEHIERYIEDILGALERELEAARDLTTRHSDDIRASRRRDAQVFVERRREPR